MFGTEFATVNLGLRSAKWNEDRPTIFDLAGYRGVSGTKPTRHDQAASRSKAPLGRPKYLYKFRTPSLEEISRSAHRSREGFGWPILFIAAGVSHPLR